MFRDKFITLTFFAVHLLGIQAKLNVYFENFYVDEVDSNYIRDAEVDINTDSEYDNTIFVNFTIVNPLPKTTKAYLEVIGMSMGEFVLPTGLFFDMDMCSLDDEPVLLGPFFDSLGFTSENCPPENGVYTSLHYEVPTDELPSEIHTNKYKIIFKFADDGKTIISLIFITEIQ
ncbi:uncharacterized protein [Fopius arisanus]|uniref:Uncharacterized protein n=2 Tax=Fopius arisanus TaxID=64838 RepID=A0A9R1T6D4_9HYME|nr:PREDICTED: uncharacterized protein LOC105266840 [Fopius arisanus]